MTFGNRFHSRVTANTPNYELPPLIVRHRELLAAGYESSEAWRIASTNCPCGNELPFYEIESVYVCAECFGEYYGEE